MFSMDLFVSWSPEHLNDIKSHKFVKAILVDNATSTDKISEKNSSFHVK